MKIILPSSGWKKDLDDAKTHVHFVRFNQPYNDNMLKAQCDLTSGVAILRQRLNCSKTPASGINSVNISNLRRL